MKTTKLAKIEKIFTKDISDEDVLTFLENGDIDVYQRKDDRIWSFNYYHPDNAEYYLSGEYHSFNISELKEYENKEDIYQCLKLYQEELSKPEVLKEINDIIKNENILYKTSHFIDGLNHFIDNNKEFGVYILE